MQYTDFEVFAHLETSLGPLFLRECDVAHHDQLWSLREYHLNPDDDALPYGRVLDAFFPENYDLQERDQELIATDLAVNRIAHYNRWRNVGSSDLGLDVIIIGEV